MKKQSTDILKNILNTQKTIENQKSISNTQKTFLEKIIQNLPNTETRNSLENISNTQETWINKILPIPTQCFPPSFSILNRKCGVLVRSTACGGGAAN